MRSSLTSDQLQRILTCKKTNDLRAILERQQLNDWINKPFVSPIKKENKLSRSFYAFLNGICNPIDIWTFILFFAAESAIAFVLTYAIPVVLLASFVFGCYKFYTTSKKATEQTQETDESFHLTDLKLQAADTLLEQLEDEIAILAKKNTRNAEQISIKVKSIKQAPDSLLATPPAKTSLSSALNVSFLTTSIITATLHYNIFLSLSFYGFAAAATLMSGFIGIGITVGIAIVMGSYLAYQYYQRGKNLNAMTALKQTKESRLQEKLEKCQQLQGIKETLRILTPPLERVDQGDVVVESTPVPAPSPPTLIAPTQELEEKPTPARPFLSKV